MSNLNQRGIIPYTLGELRLAAIKCRDIYDGELMAWAANEIELLRTLRQQAENAEAIANADDDDTTELPR